VVRADEKHDSFQNDARVRNGCGVVDVDSTLPREPSFADQHLLDFSSSGALTIFQIHPHRPGANGRLQV